MVGSRRPKTYRAHEGSHLPHEGGLACQCPEYSLSTFQQSVGSKLRDAQLYGAPNQIDYLSILQALHLRCTMLIIVPASVAFPFRSCGSAAPIRVSLLLNAVTTDTKRFLFHGHSIPEVVSYDCCLHVSSLLCHALRFEPISSWAVRSNKRIKKMAHCTTKECFMQNWASHST